MRAGVLALQGDFREHERALQSAGASPVEVRLPGQLDDIDALIVPGGESTTIGKLAAHWGLMEPIRAFARSGRPVWGTCAGMIMLATEVLDGIPGQQLLGLLDLSVRRNAFGRQQESFEVELDVPALGAGTFHAVFIRAPLVERAGQGVEVLARLADGTIVAVRQANLMATAFHPELTEDGAFHRYFLGLAGSD